MISKKTFRYSIFLDVGAKLARGFGSFRKSRDKPKAFPPNVSDYDALGTNSARPSARPSLLVKAVEVRPVKHYSRGQCRRKGE